MEWNVVTIPGDGIGKDVVTETVKVLNAVGEKYSHRFNFTEKQAGGCAIDNFGEPLPKDTVDACKAADAVLLGAVGGYKWDDLPGDKRPEAALLGLRKSLNLYANLRPAVLFKELKDASPLKEEIIGDSLDILIVRELTSGIYFGERGRSEDGEYAFDTMEYSKPEIERLARIGFEAAMKRNKKVTVVDKANILENSRLWRETVREVAEDYKDVALDFLYVDNASMQLIRDPKQFDVIVTNNMFGDILSDEAGMITGSIGMLASASLSDGSFGMYEPVHGSAPDIEGKNLANPIATILSGAMMLEYSFGLSEEARDIENAVKRVLEKGYRTQDIFEEGKKLTGTVEMGDLIKEELLK